MDLIAKSKELRENPEYSGPIWDLERLETMFEMESEITRLKKQLARTERERDQAIEAGALVVAGGSIHTDADDGYRGTAQHYPDLYAYLAGKVEG